MNIKKYKKTKGFTLVELIVVITILSILWSIAFLSFQNFSKDARDSKRISDISNFKKGLELHITKAWKYPEPDDFTSFSSWNSEIKMWKIWDTTSRNISLNETPSDPKNLDSYTYSTSWNWKYYQIHWTLENTNDLTLVSKASAVWNEWISLVEWNYIFDPSLPSLIIWDSWAIFDNTTCFIMDWSLDKIWDCNTPKSDLTSNNFDKSLVWYWDMETLEWGELKDLSWNWNNWTFNWTSFPTATTWELWGWYNFNESDKSYIEIPTSSSLEITWELTLISVFKSDQAIPKWVLTKQSTWGLADAWSWCWVNNYCWYHLTSAWWRSYDTTQNWYWTIDRTKSIWDLISTWYVILAYTMKDWEAWNIYLNWKKIKSNSNNRIIKELSVSKNSLMIWRYWNDYTSSNPWEDFDWIIDEVKIYNRKLSDSEILQQSIIAWYN